jgi:pimeloyl-ACP methyl ester carboxylesterase
MFWALAIIFILWLALCPYFLTFRSDDSEQIHSFQKEGVRLKLETSLIGTHHLHYALTGRDNLPTLVLIHGSPGSWDAFDRYMKDKELLQRFRMVAVDRPGFGKSDYGNPEHLSRQSELIAELVKSLDNHQPVFLAGHSLGGPLVIQLAADHPGMFAGLVLISASIDPKQEKPEKWRPLFFKTPLKYIVPGAMRPSNEELWYLKQDLIALQPGFGKITIPVYFIHGANDNMVPVSNVSYGENLLGHSTPIEKMIIPKANHFIPWTKYKEIKSLLLRLY